jgi:hypothetical protein
MEVYKEGQLWPIVGIGSKAPTYSLEGTGETFYIKVSNYGSAIPSYTTKLEEYTPVFDSYEPDNDPASAKTISVGQTQSRSLHVATDVDWIKFSTANGQKYKISFTSGSGFSILDGYLYDADDMSQVGYGWESTPITFTGDGGNYYIKVVSFVGKTGNYTIKLETTFGSGFTPVTRDIKTLQKEKLDKYLEFLKTQK